jgi:hypothetical protein
MTRNQVRSRGRLIDDIKSALSLGPLRFQAVSGYALELLLSCHHPTILRPDS